MTSTFYSEPRAPSSAVAHLVLLRSMRHAIAILLLSVTGALAQGTVVSDDRLPPDSIELKRNDSPATSTPWQLPKPGDPHYDADKEAQIKKENESLAKQKEKPTHHLVRAFERGIFKDYELLQWGNPAKKLDDPFMPNSKLAPDAVELSSAAHPDKADYFPTRPQMRPWNVPDDYVAVRVFHRGKVIGWTFLPKEAVAMLHKKT